MIAEGGFIDLVDSGMSEYSFSVLVLVEAAPKGLE